MARLSENPELRPLTDIALRPQPQMTGKVIMH